MVTSSLKIPWKCPHVCPAPAVRSPFPTSRPRPTLWEALARCVSTTSIFSWPTIAFTVHVQDVWLIFSVYMSKSQTHFCWTHIHFLQRSNGIRGVSLKWSVQGQTQVVLAAGQKINSKVKCWQSKQTMARPRYNSLSLCVFGSRSVCLCTPIWEDEVRERRRGGGRGGMWLPVLAHAGSRCFLLAQLHSEVGAEGGLMVRGVGSWVGRTGGGEGRRPAPRLPFAAVSALAGSASDVPDRSAECRPIAWPGIREPQVHHVKPRCLITPSQFSLGHNVIMWYFYMTISDKCNELEEVKGKPARKNNKFDEKYKSRNHTLASTAGLFIVHVDLVEEHRDYLLYAVHFREFCASDVNHFEVV